MIRAAVLLAIAALLSAPAHASRSCLDKNEAARTWPGRVLAIDDDGCWTYFRRGLKPAPADDSINDRAANAQPTAPADDSMNDRAANAQPTVPPDMREWSNTMAAMAEIYPAVQAPPWIDRWPARIVVPPKPVLVEPSQPLMREVLLVIAIVALVAVAFGGMIERRKRQTRDGYFA
jgi:hypothetical protein